MWYSGVHPEDKERVDRSLQACLEGKQIFDTKFRIVWPDNSVHDIRAFGMVEMDEKNQPLRMV